jgi:hypothetical protein
MGVGDARSDRRVGASISSTRRTIETEEGEGQRRGVWQVQEVNKAAGWRVSGEATRQSGSMDAGWQVRYCLAGSKGR